MIELNFFLMGLNKNTNLIVICECFFLVFCSSDDAFTIGLPPAWVDDSEEITFNIQKVRDKMGELAKAHSKALMPTFGDNRGDQRVVEMLTHEITDLLRKSEKRLHNLSTRGGPSEESNLRKNVQVLLHFFNIESLLRIKIVWPLPPFFFLLCF